MPLQVPQPRSGVTSIAVVIDGPARPCLVIIDGVYYGVNSTPIFSPGPIPSPAPAPTPSPTPNPNPPGPAPAPNPSPVDPAPGGLLEIAASNYIKAVPDQFLVVANEVMDGKLTEHAKAVTSVGSVRTLAKERFTVELDKVTKPWLDANGRIVAKDKYADMLMRSADAMRRAFR